MGFNPEIVYLGEVKVLAKGQIVIPKEIRDKLDIHTGETWKIMLGSDGMIGVMREKDLKKSLQMFQGMDRKESIDMIKNMQEKIDQMMKRLQMEP